MWAQLEGERGVPPIDSSGSYEVAGVSVDVSAKDADAARMGGWRLAQRKAWKMLWARVNGQPPTAAPGLSDGALDSIVGGIVVEDEQISPTRYIARLGVLFDRSRAGQLLGVHGQVARSAPMLVIPVMWDGASPVTFETRNDWQKAWARYRAGGSPIDYVRVAGTGVDPLLLNVAQARRPGRGWWRMLLEQYGASDVVVPEVTLARSWPGGPVIGTFTARYGPDGTAVDRFTLRVESSAALPRMLDEGVRRIDDAYTRELRGGGLRPDPSLLIQEEEAPPPEEALTEDEPVDLSAAATTASATFTLQIDTPDAGALGAAEQALRAVPGVRSATMTSMALGGVSLMRLTFDGDVEALRLALAARGWRAEDAGGSLRVRRAAPTPTPTPTPAPAPAAAAPTAPPPPSPSQPAPPAPR